MIDIQLYMLQMQALCYTIDWKLYWMWRNIIL